VLLGFPAEREGWDLEDLSGNSLLLEPIRNSQIVKTNERQAYALDAILGFQPFKPGSRYDVNGIRKRKLNRNRNGSREYTVGIGLNR
jgi:hypothetical protein